MLSIESLRTRAVDGAARPSAAPAHSAPAAPADTFSPSAPGDAPQSPRKWTVMVYSAGDNNLEPYLFTNLDDAEKVGSDPTTAVVSQFDRGAGKGGCQRLLIEKDTKPGVLGSTVVGNLGTKVDMAAPKTLSDFITWSKANYPAEHYMLIISDHGNGWQGCVEDDSAGTWMKLPALTQGLADARKATGSGIDIIGFDACLMASTEVAHQLKDEASYLVASEETEGAAGWPYSRVLNAEMLADMQKMLTERVSVSPRELAAHVVSSAQSVPDDLPTMSAIDLAKAPTLTAAADQFGQAILATETSRWTLRGLARQTQGFYDYKDLYDFASQISRSPKISDKALKTAAEGVKQAVEATVFAESHSKRYPNAHGITIDTHKPRSGYDELTFTRDSHWAQAMRKMNSIWEQ